MAQREGLTTTVDARQIEAANVGARAAMTELTRCTDVLMFCTAALASWWAYNDVLKAAQVLMCAAATMCDVVGVDYPRFPL